MHRLFSSLTREQINQISYLTEWDLVYMNELRGLILKYGGKTRSYKVYSRAIDKAIEELRESLRTRYNRHYMQLDWLEERYNTGQYKYLVDSIEKMFLHYINDADRKEILEYIESGQVDFTRLYEVWKEDCKQKPLVAVKRSLHRVDEKEYRYVCCEMNRYKNMLDDIENTLGNTINVSEKLEQINETMCYFNTYY